MSKLQLPECQTLLIRIPEPNSRCSSLPGVAEFPYMEHTSVCVFSWHVPDSALPASVCLAGMFPIVHYQPLCV